MKTKADCRHVRINGTFTPSYNNVVTISKVLNITRILCKLSSEKTKPFKGAIQVPSIHLLCLTSCPSSVRGAGAKRRGNALQQCAQT